MASFCTMGRVGRRPEAACFGASSTSRLPFPPDQRLCSKWQTRARGGPPPQQSQCCLLKSYFCAKLWILWYGDCPCPIPLSGKKKNIEYLLHFANRDISLFLPAVIILPMVIVLKSSLIFFLIPPTKIHISYVCPWTVGCWCNLALKLFIEKLAKVESARIHWGRGGRLLLSLLMRMETANVSQLCNGSNYFIWRPLFFLFSLLTIGPPMLEWSMVILDMFWKSSSSEF